MGETLDLLTYYEMFADPATSDMTADYRHDFGEVPFIPFYNNNIHTDDLRNIKPLIDVYDKVYSGFINDLDDIQELIFVLSGYGGEDLNSFLSDLKKYKTIPIVIQYLKGGYGAVDWGTMMAMLVLAIIPIIIFYGICQKYIIEGVVAGAVKG